MSLRAGRSGVKKSDINPVTGKVSGGSSFILIWENPYPESERLPTPYEWDFDCSNYDLLMIENTVQSSTPQSHNISYIASNDGLWATPTIGGSNRKYTIVDGVLSTNENTNNTPMKIWGVKF